MVDAEHRMDKYHEMLRQQGRLLLQIASIVNGCDVEVSNATYAGLPRAISELQRERDEAMEELAEVLEDSVRQGAHRIPVTDYYDSRAISTYADQMRRLAELGRFVIDKEHGCRVIGKFIERSDHVRGS